MAIKKWTGTNLGPTEHNAQDAEPLALHLLNLGRTLIDRSILFSKGNIDSWGDAYIDSNGRMNSVGQNAAGYDTTAVFDTNNYKVLHTQANIYAVEITASAYTDATTYNAQSVIVLKTSAITWIAYKFSGTFEQNRAAVLKALMYQKYTAGPYGFTGFSSIKSSYATDVGRVFYTVKGTFTAGGTGPDAATCDLNPSASSLINLWSYLTAWSDNALVETTMRMEIPAGTQVALAYSDNNNLVTTDGTTEAPISGTATTMQAEGISEGGRYSTFECWFSVNSGLTVTPVFNAGAPAGAWSATNSAQTITFGASKYTITESYVHHAIPSGTFAATISKAIGVPHIADWESGANIQYKLMNATEDTGWLNCMSAEPNFSSFTAFTSQPTHFTVWLKPKVSTPTVGYPAIYTFALRATP